MRGEGRPECPAPSQLTLSPLTTPLSLQPLPDRERLLGGGREARVPGPDTVPSGGLVPRPVCSSRTQSLEPHISPTEAGSGLQPWQGHHAQWTLDGQSGPGPTLETWAPAHRAGRLTAVSCGRGPPGTSRGHAATEWPTVAGPRGCGDLWELTVLCRLWEPCPAWGTARLDSSCSPVASWPWPGQWSSRPRGRSPRGLPSRTHFSAKARPHP